MQQISVVDKNTGISNGSSMDFELMQEIFQNIESLAHRLSQHECKNKVSAPFLTHRQCFWPWKTYLLSFKIKCTNSTPFIPSLTD